MLGRFLIKFFPSLRRDLSIVTMPLPFSNIDELNTLEVIILLLEDRRFFQHKGIDWRSWVRELYKVCTFRPHGGASTIDMQFVRTRTGYKERTLKRKLYEMLLARLLQSRMSKIAILRTYLEIVYLGSRISGISAAAASVFHKEVSELNKFEASSIAAMMVYPRPQKPSRRWAAAVERRASYGRALYKKHGDQYQRNH